MFTDVAQLCNVHIPAWLATEGMDETKIAVVLRGPGQASLRRLVVGEGLQLSQGHDRQTGSTGKRSAGRDSWPGSVKAQCGEYASESARGRSLLSLLLVVILIVVIFVVVVRLTGRIVRRMALVVPELAVDAIGSEQLRVRAALDRPAA